MEGRKAIELDHYIYKFLNENRIAEALAKIDELAAAAADNDLSSQIGNIKVSYRYLLKYFAENMPDPGRDKLREDIRASLYTLADQLAIAVNCQTPGELYYSLFDSYKKTISLPALMADYRTHLATLGDGSDIAKLQECEKLEQQMFKKIWLTFPFSAADYDALAGFMADEAIDVPAKAIALSALFLALGKFYDSAKLALLVESYISLDNSTLQIRALIYVVLSIFLNRNRVARDSEIMAKFPLMKDVPHFAADIENIIMRLVAARNTENLTHKVANEIMPGIMKSAPDLMKKFRDGSLSDVADIEDNPEWADALDKSGFTEKMEEMTKLQMEGNDIYMGTFSRLKSFPFFSDIANWFMPYTSRHSVVVKAFGGDNARMGVLVDGAMSMCNSDKYSLCLTISQMQGNQKEMLTSELRAHSEEIEALKSGELPKPAENRDRIANEHIQDLYRFYNLFSRRKEFSNVFNTSINLLDVQIIANMVDNPAQMAQNVANAYLKNAFYADAMHYFLLANDFSGDINPESLQKIGYACQQQGDYAKALDYYLKYEFIDNKNLWNIRHIAGCYRSLKQYDKAIKYYRLAEELSPENVAIALALGSCLLLSGNVDEAIKCYFKADYLKPDSHKTLRLIAWCSLLLANYEQSERYFAKLADIGDFSAQDHLNYGHLALVQGDIAAAVARYRKCLEIIAAPKTFADMLLADSADLAKCGISSATLALALDAVVFAQ